MEIHPSSLVVISNPWIHFVSPLFRDQYSVLSTSDVSKLLFGFFIVSSVRVNVVTVTLSCLEVLIEMEMI